MGGGGAMRRFLLALFVASVLFCGVENPRYVRADALCYQNVVPTPIPTAKSVTLGLCASNVLQVNVVGAGGSPLPTAAPAATPPYQIVCATTAPSGSVVCPTPIPLPTQPYQVNCVSGCATPIPFPTSTAPGVTATPAVSSSSGTILAAGGSTNGYVLCNPNAFVVYVNFGATASTTVSTLYFAAFPSPCYIDRGPYRYQGIITAIAGSSGTFDVTTF
jgi:hypothetical protein